MNLRWWCGVVLGLGLMTEAFAAQPAGKGAKTRDDNQGQAGSPAEETDDGNADDESDQPEEGSSRGEQADEELVKKVSYLIGHQHMTGLKHQRLEIDLEEYLRGIRDAFDDKKLEMSEDDLKKAGAQYDQMMRRKLPARMKKEGEEYLSENQKKKGVKTLPSGLQYLVLKSGEGPSPQETDTVTVHYKGTFTNGNEFDSSYRRGQPAKFPVNKVIKGWTEALQLMKVGDKWQLVIPSNLAYQETGRPGAIPPNATLIFDVELLKIDDAAPGKAAPGKAAPGKAAPGKAAPGKAAPGKAAPSNPSDEEN